MAFLTKYNLSQLSQKLEIKVEVSLEMFLEHIYKDTEIYALLNKREVEYLFKYKMLLDTRCSSFSDFERRRKEITLQKKRNGYYKHHGFYKKLHKFVIE